MSKSKVSTEERIETARACAEGRTSIAEAGRRLGVDRALVREWRNRYKAGGVLAFSGGEGNRTYTDELKSAAVREYLEGHNSQKEIAAKYGLRSSRQLRDWIKVYNSGRDFSRKDLGGCRMKNGRETTQEERIEIVRYCIENGASCSETSQKFNVSYQQVYNWVKKFRELGEAGLEDRRGKQTAVQEPRTEMEEMKIRMARLEHENHMLRMERDLLKKLDELERRDAFRK